MPTTSRLPFVLPLLLCACDPGCGAPPTSDCEIADGPGVHHSGQITADENWTAAQGVHWIDGSVTIDDAQVVIDRCVEVRVAAGANIDVGDGWGGSAALIVNGEEGHEVEFVRADPSAAWGAIRVSAPARLELTRATLIGGGGDPTLRGASLVAVGTGTLPAAAPLIVDSVRIEGSSGDAVLLDEVAAFAPASTALTIVDAGGHPLVVGEHGLDSLPDGDYAGNERASILVVEDAPAGMPGLQTDARVRDLGVPYQIGELVGDDLRVGANGGSGEATLTLEAGVILKFFPEAFVRVVADEDAPRGRLVIEGDEQAPVVLTSVAEAPAPGDWAGIYFESPIASSEIDHAIIEYAGGYCSCALVSCSPLSFYEAAVIFDGAAPPGAFMRDTLIRASAGHGIVRSWLDVDVDFSDGVEFEDVVGCEQTMPTLSDQVCPDPAFTCAGD